MCAHLAISAASEATGAMSGVCAVAVGALAGLIGLKVSFAAPPRAPKKRQPRNGVTERERPRCFCEPLGAEPMSIRSRLPRASVAKGPPGISFHSSEAADHLNCTRVSTGHWCGTGVKKAHLTVRVSLARLFPKTLLVQQPWVQCLLLLGGSGSPPAAALCCWGGQTPPAAQGDFLDLEP